MSKINSFKLSIFLALFLGILFSGSHALAAEETPDFGVTPGSGGGTVAPASGAPDLKNLGVPLVRLFNMLVLGSGLVFVMMLFYSAYKYSLAQGDPKGVAGAKETMNHALFGFLVTIGTFALLNIIGGIFGIEESVTANPGEASKNSIQELLEFLQNPQ